MSGSYLFPNSIGFASGYRVAQMAKGVELNDIKPVLENNGLDEIVFRDKESNRYFVVSSGQFNDFPRVGENLRFTDRTYDIFKGEKWQLAVEGEVVCIDKRNFPEYLFNGVKSFVVDNFNPYGHLTQKDPDGSAIYDYSGVILVQPATIQENKKTNPKNEIFTQLKMGSE